MKWDIKDIKTWGPQKHLPGSTIPDAGNARGYFTGSWRTDRPVFHEDKCTNCLACYFYCPDCSILVVEQQMTGIDYDHCKGCGICANECPADAITMHPETDFRGDK
jgi:pyruvate ferredoxin oxidoreductase delta subunit